VQRVSKGKSPNFGSGGGGGGLSIAEGERREDTVGRGNGGKDSVGKVYTNTAIVDTQKKKGHLLFRQDSNRGEAVMRRKIKEVG